MIELTRVYKINDKLVIARELEYAIKIYQEYYPSSTIRTTELITSDSFGLNDLALIRSE